MSVPVGETSREDMNGIQHFQRDWPIQLLVLVLVLAVVPVVPSSALCGDASPSWTRRASTDFRHRVVGR
jgi:hypothetical protein